ncbi:MAG TPA: SulP family inorganic anion transporter [Deltaproteobacteria bacterium]|nr:SulP family inorganic anion transporter [Deltaproteobacteria bacterium]
MQLSENIRNDLPASIVVFFVAVPLCLGIALASGAPLFSGLIAGIVGGLLVGALSGSALGVSGPAAGLAVIVVEAIRTLGSFEAFLVAVVLAGFIQLGLGAARAGVLGYFFPSSVVKGMLSGIGLLIAFKQIPHALGWDSDPEGDLSFFQLDGENTFSEILRAMEHVDATALAISIVALAILVFWERIPASYGRFVQFVKGPLVAVVFGITCQLVLRKVAPDLALGDANLVSVPVARDWTEMKALFVGPDWSQLGNGAVYVTAVTLAVVASLETLLSVEAIDKLDPLKRVTPTNRELLAQGSGNVVSGLLGGLPVTQVIVRSSANVQSGGRTKVSAILHGVLLLVFTFAFPGMLNLIPLSVLASILFVVGYKLARPSLFVSMYEQGMSQFVPFAVTIVGMLVTDLLTGVFLGFAVAVIVILHRSYLNSHFLHVETRDEADGRHRVRIRLAEEVTFLNRGAILRELSEIPDGSEVTIDRSQSVWVDPDVEEILEDFEASAGERGIRIRTIHRSSDGDVDRPGLDGGRRSSSTEGVVRDVQAHEGESGLDDARFREEASAGGK